MSTLPAARSFLFAFILILTGQLSADAATLALSASSTGPAYGAPVTLTATVNPTSATGRVTFYSGTTVIGVSALSSGVAATSTALLPSGPQKVFAYYAGDGSNSAATS